MMKLFFLASFFCWAWRTPLLSRLDDMLQKLETIAGNVKPPLPTPLMAAAVLFVFCTTLPARLAAAWGCLVRWARSVVNPPAATPPKGRWALGVSRLVVLVDGVLSPFKLEDWQERARAAETAAAQAKAKTKAAEAKLDRTRVILERMQAILDHALSGAAKENARNPC
ncbi:hypothetical protein K469DRAFT_713574 [Zopfia rhizophila CBS 207.26]|uniref:Uncharacterized protein n=1 Tax=Zopfia rhizophila CBS 207.26 TaxID=1314779 RepID=A0A6A6DV11_9PEZI|nr:hypothetical protein K469DRAFT_713574 [Zopfia rhizophila CBS 207.26]